jgi:hypothetical protein
MKGKLKVINPDLALELETVLTENLSSANAEIIEDLMKKHGVDEDLEENARMLIKVTPILKELGICSPIILSALSESNVRCIGKRQLAEILEYCNSNEHEKILIDKPYVKQLIKCMELATEEDKKISHFDVDDFGDRLVEIAQLGLLTHDVLISMEDPVGFEDRLNNSFNGPRLETLSEAEFAAEYRELMETALTEIRTTSFGM